MDEPRSLAIAVLVCLVAVILLLCRFFASRTPRPAVVWGAGGYWVFLHLICVYGLLTSTRFDSALAQLTLFTFPFSVGLGDGVYPQGFATLPDLAANYVRYVLVFGGLDALGIAAFLTLVVPGRMLTPRPPYRRSSHHEQH